MAMMISQERAVAVIGEERCAVLRECLDEAWSLYDSNIRPLVPLASPTGLANSMHELVIEQVRQRLTGMRGVVIHDHGASMGRFLAEIDHTLLLSFKKLKRDFLTSNFPTDRARAFDEQEADLEGMPSLPRLTVGYQLDAFGATVVGMWLAFVVGKECVWHHDLRSGTTSLELEFPRPNVSAPDEERAADEWRATASRRLRRVAEPSPRDAS